MVVPDSYEVKKSTNNSQWVRPLTCSGLKMMSFGFVNPNAGVPGAVIIICASRICLMTMTHDGLWLIQGGRSAAVMRGPMVSRVINQLAACTEWGELDILVLSMTTMATVR
jgi:hypothetical protein